MKNRYYLRILSCALLMTVLVIYAGSCTSRYRLSLYITEDSGRKKIKTEDAIFTAGTVLNNPYADTRIILGKGNTIVVPASRRGSSLYKSKASFLSFDELLKLRIYLELPETFAPGDVELVDHAYVLILEQYDKPIKEKVFLPESGNIVIDSISSGRLFVTMSGEFVNSSNRSLAIDGQFKVKFSD